MTSDEQNAREAYAEILAILDRRGLEIEGLHCCCGRVRITAKERDSRYLEPPGLCVMAWTPGMAELGETEWETGELRG